MQQVTDCAAQAMVCAAVLCEPLVDCPALRFVVEIEIAVRRRGSVRTIKDWRSPLRSMVAASGEVRAFEKLVSPPTLLVAADEVIQ